ncbi:E3 ubiquitin-protein ligase ptr1 [Erysiphe neolycopersici]|uniref:HECT-type E3 ubiquitin transferase n=1 Tax=Erysiphe neolycopersici TaxID=212602 RepID=A0A420HZL6_9PEZI|nr:E3 ubiquitin-protein ligase ptr1 [Erysiphe neolycopersici]
MVRITKVMQPKHAESLTPWTKDFCDRACSLPLTELSSFLSTFPTRWPFPRGDLHHWIPLLNRFDTILEQFCKIYKLDEGPQLVEFENLLLNAEQLKLDNEPHQEADRELIESILNFSRMLIQNCGNRTVYASSSHLDNLLNTTSLSLLESTLYLGSELAQRYQSAIKRMSVTTRHLHNSLLQSHYNIPLEKVVKLALPFSRIVTSPADNTQSNSLNQGAKVKEKTPQNVLTSSPKNATTTICANDIMSMVRGGTGIGSTPNSICVSSENASNSFEADWNDWGDVKLIFYPKSQSDIEGICSTPSSNITTSIPKTPTPVRRSSNLGPRGQRSSKLNPSESPTGSSPVSSTYQSTDEAFKPSFKIIEIPQSRLMSTDIHSILQENINGLPKELQYELLVRLRIAYALTSSLESRRQIVAIRILAIINLAYIYPDSLFQDLILKHEIEQPRRLQLVHQLAELVHPPTDGETAVPRKLQALAFVALEVLQGHQSRVTEVSAALNTNVNHGVLLYVVRKAVAEMNRTDSGDHETIDDEWRDCLFSLLSSISLISRTAIDLVAAGLIQILVDILNQRTSIAERYYPMVLTFLDNVMYSARDGFQTLVEADGLNAISNLIIYQVRTAAENVSAGKGTPQEFRSAVVDYKIPYYQQQTIKWLFKFIHHLMSATGGFGGNFDRLLRNLIDSSQLLASLRQIIGNANLYGSIVWTNAVLILNDFINNEPTSYVVIAEAGLSKGLLEAVTGRTITIPDDSKVQEIATEPSISRDGTTSPSIHIEDESDEETPHVERLSLNMLKATRKGPLAQGILPTSDTIGIVPQAFNAICLNTAGMKMFQASNALQSFFEIFESPEHVKCMDIHKELPATLGSSFDELARHHPGLKNSIIIAIVNMVARVEYLCSSRGKENMLGAKLWSLDNPSKITMVNYKSLGSSNGSEKQIEDSKSTPDVEMHDADAETDLDMNLNTDSDLKGVESDVLQTNMTPYICATINFLSSILGNTSIRTGFCVMGGIENVLGLSQSPSLEYDFWESTFSLTIHQVIAMLAESKPHLTVPSLLKRALKSVEELRPFTSYEGSSAFFSQFVNSELKALADVDVTSKGTKFAKALVSVHSLVSTIMTCFQSPPYNHRGSSNTFHQINVADYCIQLVQSLGPLLASSLREVIKLRHIVPDNWKDATSFENSVNVLLSNFSTTGSRPAGHTAESDENHSNIPPNSSNSIEKSGTSINTNSSAVNPGPVSKIDMESPAFKNYITLKFLLKKLPRIISPFFQTLGKILLAKRNLDPFQKQYHFAVADALANSILNQITIEENIKENLNLADTYTYWLGMISLFHELLLEYSNQNERHSHTNTLVVQAFKEHGGFERLNQMLDIFANTICAQGEELKTVQEPNLLVELATSGIISLLSLYGNLVNGINFTEAPQTTALITRTERDRRGMENFSAPQFLIEMRMIILPTVRRLWSSDLIEKGSSQISEKLIHVIRMIVLADSENIPTNRLDRHSSQTKMVPKVFKINQDSSTTLLDQGYTESLVNEALYRCNNNLAFAQEYCRELKGIEDPTRRNPIPEKDIEAQTEAENISGFRATESTSSSSLLLVDHPMEQETNPGTIDSFNELETPLPGDELANFDQLLTSLVPVLGSGPTVVAGPSETILPQESAKENSKLSQVTVHDLNKERALISDNLIDKCLDAINANGEVTFDIADLIMTVVNKSNDPVSQQKAIGETLVVALMSFVGEDDFNKSGKKIASYAHLLALLLRDKSFYSATVPELKQNLDSLLTFIKLSPNHVPEEPSPWISHILLLVEMLLSEDEKPQKIKWTPPSDENSVMDVPDIEAPELLIPLAYRSSLLENILEILPRIGKDEPLALSVLRVLVIITRNREIAQTVAEKKNIQRLFVMTKQLAGVSSARIHSPLMLILRHIIEDHDTIKQIMKSEIKTSLEPIRSQRNVDEKTYLRLLAHNALRNPELFVKVTEETVKLNRWSYPSTDSPSRHYNIILKQSSNDAPQIPPIDTVLPTVQATEDLSIQDLVPCKEASDVGNQEGIKPGQDKKLPVAENSDGVIHFLLCELMNYRDVDEREHALTIPSLLERSSKGSNGDIPMGGTPLTPTINADNNNTTPLSKKEFKAEEHPIYIYRCFILQCLTELLSSYNRTKIDFINFKRSSQPQLTTSTKPRSSVVNYLLYDLVPTGTLEHAENTYLRKKIVTSSWANCVLAALLCKTNEQPLDKSRDPYETEVEPDLLFVRRFVLENILKAYKDASSSNEPLDIKYSRLLGLAELMTHIIHGKENIAIIDQTNLSASQKQIRRIMFEKGYISALTSSIADIDLNFPGAKRAVKYILRPLKTLTQTAIVLSDLSLIKSTPDQGDEEEIESAKSISESEDEREETPDLFRNSTLGMFEHGNGDSDSQSGDNEDEDMEGTYDEYVDEMDYDDGEMDENDDDDISDEDEIEGIGSIEGLSGDHQVEVEVFMNDHDDDHDLSPDNDDDSGSGDDDEDDDHRVEIIEELEDIQHHDDDELADEWESDGQDDDDDDRDGEDYEGSYEDQEEEGATIDLGAMSHLVRVLEDDPAALEMLGRMAEGEENQGEDVVADYAEEDEDDDDENDDDEDDIFENQHAIDSSNGNVTFGWPPEIRTVLPARIRSRSGFSPFPSFPGGSRNPLGGKPGISLSRSIDDGTNPLLQRNNSDFRVTSSRPPLVGTWIPAIRGSSNNDLLDIGFATQGGNTTDGLTTTQFLEDVIRTLPLPGHLGRHGQALQFHITTSGPGSRHMPPELEAFFGNRHTRFEERRTVPEPVSVSHFTAQSTVSRWAEEAKILFGGSWVDRAADLSGSLLSFLVPPAIEADKAQKAAQLERTRQEKLDAEKKAEEERLENEAKANEENSAREKKEIEELQIAHRTNESNITEETPVENTNIEPENENQEAAPESMEGVETELPENNNSNQPASIEARERIVTVIRGNTFDITDLGIDADFLSELPEEIREEVIMSAVAERRSHAAAAGAQPSEIDQEFLNALPDDIRDEIIQQERRDRRRREREERNRQNIAANGGPSVGDMDAATILATLDPTFRSQVLMEQDEATLALLPPEIADQARNTTSDQGRASIRDFANSLRLPNTTVIRHQTGHIPPPYELRDSTNQRSSRRSTVQILDKSGVATLLRLMFISQHGTLRSTFNSVLQNISMNKFNRQEILGTILYILQDGSIDMAAIERSFAYLSIKAKQSKDVQIKTPQPLKRSLTGSSSIVQTNFEASPLMIVSQCLTTLVFLNQFNQHIAAYFLMEHDTSGSLKRSLSRKGKGKENKSSKYAINTLLSLLDRKLIMESSSIMESLSTLLNMITLPLQVLQRKNKDAESVIIEPVQSIPGTITSITSPETSSTNNEHSTDTQARTDNTSLPTSTQNSSTQIIATAAEQSLSTNPADVATAKADNLSKNSEKRLRTILPPIIPDSNLKLVINIFVARECSSKTFRETLSTIKNLSAIPDAKAVFGRELVNKARYLGDIILQELEELLPHIQKANSGTEIQGVALAKISPGGSDQNKLLRVLTALDHLFDPKREKKDKNEESQPENESSQLIAKDLLYSLYENSTFGRMWQMLSDCLNAIRQRENMLNVATILLPLIEALMVVCKNTAKENFPSNFHQGKELALTSPPPDSRLGSLFFTFTEEHRKILNELVRHTPKLMSGTFSLLVKNPKVLEFDNKRNYFNRNIHAKSSNTRETYPTLQLSVRRDLVFHDSFKSLYFQSGDQMKYGKLSIRFHGEEGIDAGGVTREWFQVLSRQMFDPGYALFIPVSSDRTTFHPNKLSSVNEEHLMFFKFIGRIIGKALYEGRVLDCHFSRAVYKRILGKAVSLKDMESLDPDYYKSLIWMLENDITDIMTETFSVDSDKFGVNETIDFIPNGRNINVTEENKHEYVRLMVEWRLTGSVKEQLDEFLKGFHDIVPADLVSIFNEQELELLISGLPEIDVDDWKANTEYHNYTASSPQIHWFWRAVRSFDKEERAKLLQFVTGTSKVPLNGFKELEGMNGFSRFNIQRDYGNKNRLPSSHTCFNQLDIPEYESYEILRQQLLTAITAGSEYFGFA